MSFLKNFLQSHPNMTAWAGLAAAMVVILLVAARDVALLPGQMATLIVSTILLAGLCVWIINWE